MSAFKDLTGQRFGKLIVQKRSNKKCNTNNVVWICLCDCGITTDPIPGNHLMTGHTKSCGCLKEKHGQSHAGHRTFAYRMWEGSKYRSKRDGIPWDLQLSDIVIPEYCPVFGVKLNTEPGQSINNAPSIDKLIPALGYVKNNIRIISYRANSIKKSCTLEELKALTLWLEKETR